MAEFFSQQSTWIWTIVLAALLFLPVRQLIWVVSVRRAERDGDTDEGRRHALKRRANVTSALLCFVFAFFYVSSLLSDR